MSDTKTRYLIDYGLNTALAALQGVLDHDGLAQGGEQSGNWEHVIVALAALKRSKKLLEDNLAPPNWYVVPPIGEYVTTDHPVTVLNPDKNFTVDEIEIRRTGAYVRGADTMFFNVKMVKPAKDE